MDNVENPMVLEDYLAFDYPKNSQLYDELTDLENEYEQYRDEMDMLDECDEDYESKKEALESILENLEEEIDYINEILY